MVKTGRWLCEIKEAEEKGDSIRGAIPERDYLFWQTQCVPYPDPEDSAHCPPRHKLPERCTFKMIEKDGGFIRKGKCTNCGECCRPLDVYMLKDGICRYAYGVD